MTFIQILNPIVSYLLKEKAKGEATINIRKLIDYIKDLDDNERIRILNKLEVK